MHSYFKVLVTVTVFVCASCPERREIKAQEQATTTDEWMQLFNGQDLNDWIVKLNHHELGDNYGDTFRVNDGMIQVRYDQYDDFGDRFGHLYYKEPFSHYHLAVEYRFVEGFQRGAPEYARMNSGMMLHSQDPKSILTDQNWPIAIELQFYASLGDGRPRPTGNACTPGTHVSRNGRQTRTHILNARGKTFPPDAWVRAEAIVRGNGTITHIINGETVLEYSNPVIGGEVVSGHDPKVFVEGKPLSEGYIGLQSEGQPLDVRKIELKVLQPE